MHVSTATHPDFAEVAALVCADSPYPHKRDNEEFILTNLISGELDPQGVFVARCPLEPRIAGVLITQTMPGQVGSVLPPMVHQRVPNPAKVQDALLQAAFTAFRSKRVAFLQAILSTEDMKDAEPLQRNGFRHITQMEQMLKLGPLELPISWEGRPTLRYSPFEHVDLDSFTSTLFATYHGSLDVPESGQGRTQEEILADLLHGSPNTTHWWLASNEAHEPVGVLLLGLGKVTTIWDVTYIGILPKFRGQRIGRAMMNFITERAIAEGIGDLHLSVDVRNQPARQLYKRDGFLMYRTQEVFLWRAS